MLLGAVVKVALDPAALRVGGRDDARPRCLELVDLDARGEAESAREPAAEDARSTVHRHTSLVVE